MTFINILRDKLVNTGFGIIEACILLIVGFFVIRYVTRFFNGHRIQISFNLFWVNNLQKLFIT